MESLKQIKKRTLKQLVEMSKDELVGYLYSFAIETKCGENRIFWMRFIYELKRYQRERV